MNGGLYRTPQPSDRRVINRSESAAGSAASGGYRPTDDPQSSVKDDLSLPPRPMSRSATSSQSGAGQSSKKGAVWTIVLVTLALVIGAAGGVVGSRSFGGAPLPIDANSYQVVQLMNGQLYFGKLTRVDDTHFKLTNVYNLQANAAATDESDKTSATTEAPAANKFELIKLSNAIYGPKDEMIISEDQIVYYQNLTDNSRAAQLIKDDK